MTGYINQVPQTDLLLNYTVDIELYRKTTENASQRREELEAPGYWRMESDPERGVGSASRLHSR
jgi:hypothetical protein